MKIVSIIPARSGSKSIPKKNIQLLNGLPLLAYSIRYSIQSSMVNKTCVSTDSSDIAALAVEHGATVPFLRPKKFSTDTSQDFEFMRHALDFFEHEGDSYDYYVLLRPTSPLRPSGLIERGISIMEKHPECTSVRSVAVTKEHPYRAWVLNDDGSMSSFVEDIFESYNIPRQSLPTALFQTGDIEVIRRRTLLSGSISGECVFPLVLRHEDMIDIDHWDDLKAANEKLSL